MTSITDFLGSDHKRCDDLFASAETHVSKQRWDEAQTDFAGFAAALERHFTMEETILFPEFEEATGSNQGPTSVMRMEHQQMRSILAMMRDSLDQRDAENFFGYSETLNTMMQQHNMKEESILYVMTDRVLAGRQSDLISAMSGVVTAS
jgi:hemerythrin-like domain-containing protein